MNTYRAQLAAQAGAAEALRRLTAAEMDCTITAYGTYSVSYKGAGVVAPMLSILKPATDGTGIARQVFLASSTNQLSAPAGIGIYANSTLSVETVNINSGTTNNTTGWIGLSSTTGSAQVVPVEWVLLQDDTGKVVGRYAYWCDDESARIDMKVSGTTPIVRDNGDSVTEISFKGLFASDPDSSAFVTARNTLPSAILGLYWFRQLSSQWALSHELLKASLGTGSIADERGALGLRRFNLNDWALKDSTYTNAAGRQALVSKVVALGDYIQLALPSFGQRYYSGGVSTNDQRRYAVKIAANIQDYIDADSQPTVIKQDLATWLAPPDPNVVGDGAPDAPPSVFGKEVVPAVGEYLGYYYNEGGRLRIDHTFEIWNPHSKDLDFSRLGNVRVLLSEINDITPNTSSNAPDPDVPGEAGSPPLALAIITGTIPAGRYGLLTTLPAASGYRSQWVTGSPLFLQLPRVTGSAGTYSYGSAGLRMEGDILATSADVDTEISVINEYGYLDIQARVAQQGPITFTLTTGTSRLIASQSFGNDPSGSGNNVHRRYPLDSGDPRSLTEVFSK
jgi:hypothetical protein